MSLEQHENDIKSDSFVDDSDIELSDEKQTYADQYVEQQYAEPLQPLHTKYGGPNELFEEDIHDDTHDTQVYTFNLKRENLGVIFTTAKKKIEYNERVYQGIGFFPWLLTYIYCLINPIIQLILMISLFYFSFKIKSSNLEKNMKTIQNITIITIIYIALIFIQILFVLFLSFHFHKALYLRTLVRLWILIFIEIIGICIIFKYIHNKQNRKFLRFQKTFIQVKFAYYCVNILCALLIFPDPITNLILNKNIEYQFPYRR